MAIPFPKMHIAQSVLNRIFNTLDELEPPPMVQPHPPITADPAAESIKLDEALEQPLPGGTANPAEAQGMLMESVAGGSPLDGALNSILL